MRLGIRVGEMVSKTTVFENKIMTKVMKANFTHSQVDKPTEKLGEQRIIDDLCESYFEVI